MNPFSKYINTWPGIIFILLLLNILAAFAPFRVDLTDEKRYTLSPATRKLLEKIEEPVTIDILLKGEFPAVFKKLQNSTSDLLQEMQRYSGNKLLIKFTDAQDLISEDQKEILFTN
jgi:ABC-type uncharacterized transport system involved in gliding motility auxiliary subunit